MPNETPDVKPVETPSASTAVKSASSPAANAAPPTGDAKPEPTSMAEALDRVLKDSSPSATEDKPEAPADGDVQTLNPTDKPDAQPKDETTPSADKEEPSADETTDEAKGPIPYERFQEVVTERNTLKEDYEKALPIVETHRKIVDFCSQHNVSQEQFAQGLEIMALLNTNPQEGLKRLLPVIEAMQQVTGDKLPTDLAAEVESGDLTLARAKELSVLRAQNRMGEETQKKTLESSAKAESERLMSALRDAYKGWDATKRGSDPSFKPKAAPNAPDGKYELVQDRFQALLHAVDAKGQPVNPVRSSQDVSKLLERAYVDISGVLGRMVPKPATKKVLSSHGSLPSSGKEPSSLADVIKAELAKHG